MPDYPGLKITRVAGDPNTIKIDYLIKIAEKIYNLTYTYSVKINEVTKRLRVVKVESRGGPKEHSKKIPKAEEKMHKCAEEYFKKSLDRQLENN